MQSKPKRKSSLEKIVKFDLTYNNLQCFFKRTATKHSTPYEISKTLKSRDKAVSSKLDRATTEKSQMKTETQPKLDTISSEILKNNSKENIKSKSPDLTFEVMNKVLADIEMHGISKTHSDVDQHEDYQDLDIIEQHKIWQHTPDKSFVSTAYQTNLADDSYYNNYMMMYMQQPLPQDYFQIRYNMIETDGRTTVMIKNIPNKYTLKLIVDEIDARYANSYDFLYLPFDIANNCNIGYAFINFVSYEPLREFYLEYNNKKWLRFKSEKICHITYAKLQGRLSLMEHFHNSKIYNQKDKRYKPIIKEVDKMEKISQLLTKQRSGNTNQ